MLLQFEHWRRPRGTLSSRQTTLLTAACTQTAKAARCPPSTAAPTPAPNQSRTSRPTERSCAWSPARLRPRRVLQTDSFWPPAPRLLLYVRARSCLLTPVQETRWRLCERGAIMYKMLLPSFFSGKHPVTPFVAPATTSKTPKVRQLCSFEGLYAFQTS